MRSEIVLDSGIAAGPAVRVNIEKPPKKKNAGLTQALILNGSDKYSCGLSVQPAVEVEAGVRARDDVFGPMSVHDVLKRPLSSPLTEAAAPSGFAITCSPRLQDQSTFFVNGVYFQEKRGQRSTYRYVPPQSPSPLLGLSFPSFRPYLSVSPPPPLVYHLVSSNNASSQFTSHLSLSCARTLSSPFYYVVSVRFADGVICMKTGGQRRTAFFHIYRFLTLRRTEPGMTQEAEPFASILDDTSVCWTQAPAASFLLWGIASTGGCLHA